MAIKIIYTNLFERNEFTLIHHFKFPHILTWGANDRKRREIIRQSAIKGFPKLILKYDWYGFHIKVSRNRHSRPLDIENVSKLIIDSFSQSQINRDKSSYPQLVLYEDDSLDYVRILHVEGEFTLEDDNTEVWIYGKK